MTAVCNFCRDYVAQQKINDAQSLVYDDELTKYLRK